jgi:hypothetical protein
VGEVLGDSAGSGPEEQHTGLGLGAARVDDNGAPPVLGGCERYLGLGAMEHLVQYL